jgi:hypothetical protein
MIFATDILRLLEESKAPYWIVMNKNQRNNGAHPKIAEYGLSDDASVEESTEKLKGLLDILTDGKYIIKFYEDDKQKKNGFYEVDFIVTGKPVNQYGQTTHQINGIAGAPGNILGGPANIGEVVAEKVQAILDKKELEELKKKVVELEQQKEDPSGWKTQLARIMGTINDTAPHLVPVLAQEALGIVKGIAGFFRPATLSGSSEMFATIPNNRETEQKPPLSEMNQEQLEQIEKELEEKNQDYAQVLFRLRAVDPDLLNTLNKMADKAESNPGIISMLKNFL